MNNGVGVSTPRGTGTSGYVMLNAATLKAKIKQEAPPKKYSRKSKLLLEHEQRRKVELECKKLEIELKEQNMDLSEINKIVSEKRQKLLSLENTPPESGALTGSIKLPQKKEK